MPRKKKRNRGNRTRHKSHVKDETAPLPKFTWTQHVLRMVTPLWILSGIAFGLAGVLYGILHYRYAALWMAYIAIVLGSGSLFAWFHSEVVKYETTHTPNVSVAAEVWLTVAQRDQMRFAFVSHSQARNKTIISPINDLVFVRLTNDSISTQMIHYFVVEMSKDGHKWEPGTLIDFRFGKIFWIDTQQGLQKATELRLEGPQLKDAIADKNIQSGETVKGWLLVECPAGFDAGRWRLRVQNIKRVQFACEFSRAHPIEPAAGDFAGRELRVMPEQVDLRGIQIVYYSERNKLP